MTIRHAIYLFALVLLTQNSRAEPRMLQADEAPRPQIIAAVSDFLSKLADGDAQETKALFAGDAEQTELLEAHLDWVNSFEKLRKVLPPTPDKKELPLPLNVPEIIRLRIGTLKQRLIIVNGNRGSVSEGSAALDLGTRLELRDGKWLVTHLVSHRAMTKGLNETLHNWNKLAKTIKAGIDSGKIKTFADVDDVSEKEGKSNIGRLFYAAPASLYPPPVAAPIKWDPPSAQALTKLPGTPIPSDEINDLFSSLPGLPTMSATPTIVSFMDDEAGIRYTNFFKPPRTLRSIDLFAAGADGFAQYPGKLPQDLSFSDKRSDIEKHLGRPPRSSTHSSQYSAFYPTLGLEITYQKESGRDPNNPIHHISLIKPNPKGDEPLQQAAASPRLTFRLIKGTEKTEAEIMTMANSKETRLVLPDVILDEKSIENVRATSQVDQPGHLAISMEMTLEGAKKLEQFSGTNNGRSLAIILDGQILSAPTIRGVVSKRIMIDMGAAISNDAIDDLAAQMHAAINVLPK